MRYISREVQRTFARILRDADITHPEQVQRVAAALEHNNGTPALAFLNAMDKAHDDR